MPTLRDLLAGVEVIAIDPPAAASLEIASVTDDSRRIGAGTLFVALLGQTVDGHGFVATARTMGAAAVVVERPMPESLGPTVLVRSSMQALATIAANLHGRPAAALRLTGITGTNGKTTSSYLLEQVLAASGRSPGVIGTIGVRSPAGARAGAFTTPTPLSLHASLAEMRDAGCTDVVLECSSHALALDRLVGLDFTAAAFTNLTRDHLDFHAGMEKYAEAKARLFSERLREDGVAVICVDGELGKTMIEAAGERRVIRVSTGGREAEVRAWGERVEGGTRVSCETSIAGSVVFDSPLVGDFNVENLGVVIGLGLGLGLGLRQIADALAAARGAPGRLERIEGAGLHAYVDYAHTPDALDRAIAALRPSVQGKLWVVFGCGGDRDRTKRPIMGRIAVEGADHVVVTSDNPRTESARAIIDEILAGMRGHEPFDVIEDRAAAIARVVSAAAPGDVILVAGKGHEDYQIIGTEKRHFDDREVLRAALARRGGETSAAT